jgi:hypothetical protein
MLSLRIFAYHIATIALCEPGKFGLHPFADLRVEVEIKPSQHGHIWDQVYLNGECCGNRWGGTKAYAELIRKAHPEIDLTDGQPVELLNGVTAV